MPVGIKAAAIAGVQPAIGADRRRGGRRVAPVARKHAGAAHQDLVLRAQAHLGASDRQPGAAGPGVALGGGGAETDGLGEPVGLDEVDAEGAEPGQHVRRDRGGAGDGVAQ